jgi:protein gp37
VFTNSLSDFFEDRRDLDLARLEALDIMAQTPNLDWLILTKRPEQIRASLIRAWSMAVYGSGLADFLRAWTGRWGWDTMAPANVWLGTTVESQHQIGRVDALLDVPAAVHFVSAEPLLGPILLNPYLYALAPPYRRIDWVICGGESGPQARWMDPQWAREVLVQCAVARVPFLFKQMGGRGRDKGGRTLDGRMFEQFPEGPCTTP